MNATVKKESKTRTILNQVFVFGKAQFSAFIGGITDYTIMVFLTEVFHIHYTFSIVIGGIIGAVINFSLNKAWTFRVKSIPYKNTLKKQLFKFIVVAINSILLKSSGTYLVTTFLGFNYKISRILIDLFVSIVFNYNLQKYWVFKKKIKVN
jgi:putative flippase GtrA